MKTPFLLLFLLIAALLAGCAPAPTAAPSPLPTAPPPTATETATSTAAPTATPTTAPTPTPLPPTPTPAPSRFPLETPPPPATKPPGVTADLLPTLPYTPTADAATGAIAGRLYYPAGFIPALTVYAVSLDGDRFYQVQTAVVPPGKPAYEITGVAPGVYHVYAYPTERRGDLGGGYTYLAACNAGHIPVPTDEPGCWRDAFHDLAPVAVRAGYLVGEVDIYDWYTSALPAPPGG